MTSVWFSDPYEQRGTGTPSRLVLNLMRAPSARPHAPAACGINAVGEGSVRASVAVGDVVWADAAAAGVPVGLSTTVEPEPPVQEAVQASRGARSEQLMVMLIGRILAQVA
jgi:hypothetical protein